MWKFHVLMYSVNGSCGIWHTVLHFTRNFYGYMKIKCKKVNNVNNGEKIRAKLLRQTYAFYFLHMNYIRSLRIEFVAEILLFDIDCSKASWILSAMLRENLRAIFQIYHSFHQYKRAIWLDLRFFFWTEKNLEKKKTKVN